MTIPNQTTRCAISSGSDEAELIGRALMLLTSSI